MTRRRRLTFTPKRKRKTPKVIGGDPDAPSDAEWKTMKEFGSFIVRDEDGDEHVFKKGDTATILPHDIPVGQDLDLCDYWLAKIREVRARDEEDVWTRVQWYWSGPEVQTVIKSFNADVCGSYERIFSDQYDYVSSSAYDAVVPMKKLNDQDLEQPDIGPETFYTRYTFEYKARVIDPRPGANSCTCNIPYDTSNPAVLMHFCPRPSCRRFYHSTCLAKSKSYDRQDASARPLRLLSSSPDSDSPFDLDDLEPVELPPPKKQKKQAGTGKTVTTAASEHRSTDSTVLELLSGLPEGLVEVAQQAIVRGGVEVTEGSLTGNVKTVVKARRMVYEALQEVREVPEDWEEEIGVGNEIDEDGEDVELQAWICPQCGGAI